MKLRGADLREVHAKALDHLDEAGLSTTLVCVVRKGLNDHELGDIIRHGLSHPCVRGVTFQPIQDAGRNLDFDKAKDRIVLSEIRSAILNSSGAFGPEDIIPLPARPVVGSGAQ
jgi:uncharacterized radical SAM superfamily Fe-S cluster-containing enzyme